MMPKKATYRAEPVLFEGTEDYLKPGPSPLNMPFRISFWQNLKTGEIISDIKVDHIDAAMSPSD